MSLPSSTAAHTAGLPLMICHLNDDYQFNTYSLESEHKFQIVIRNKDEEIGSAELFTDQSDFAWITHLKLNPKHASHAFGDQTTLGSLLAKYLLKMPWYKRKLEFRFMTGVEPHLSKYITPYFSAKDAKENGDPTEVMLARQILLPKPKESKIKYTISEETIAEEQLSELIDLLKRNAYWQENLSLNRLRLLVSHSNCFVAKNADGKMIGFVRAVTDGERTTLWDGVVDEAYRRSGVATEIMRTITDKLSNTHTWLLFNGGDTTRPLYKAMGFVPYSEFIGVDNLLTFVKTRTQERPSAYMQELMALRAFPRVLSSEQTHAMLSAAVKRENLAGFFGKVLVTETATSVTNGSAASAPGTQAPGLASIGSSG